MDSFIKSILDAARTIAVECHGYVEEDGFILNPNTVQLVAEMEEANRSRLIDQALKENNRDAFMRLTAR